MGANRSLPGWDGGESTLGRYRPESAGTTSRQPALPDQFHVAGGTSGWSSPRDEDVATPPQAGAATSRCLLHACPGSDADFAAPFPMSPIPLGGSRHCPRLRTGTGWRRPRRLGKGPGRATRTLPPRLRLVSGNWDLPIRPRAGVPGVDFGSGKPLGSSHVHRESCDSHASRQCVADP